MKLLFPDACWNPGVISGASFLYFKEEALTFSLHPSVSTFLTGINPSEFIEFVNEKKPAWQANFNQFVGLWSRYRSTLDYTSKILQPLHGNGFKTIMFSYNRGDYAWEAAEELIAASSLPFGEIQATIDPFSASDELFAHIFFEAYLKLYEGDRTLELSIARGKEAASGKPPETKISDWTPLFEYCDARFKSTPLEQLLITAYMFRLPILKQMPAVLLTNAKLVPFLSSLPIEVSSKKKWQDDSKSDEDGIDRDVIAWEFFRQLTSPRLDPIDEETVNRIRELVVNHPAEIAALRRRCFDLATDLSDEKNLGILESRIANYVRSKVKVEIQELFFLNKAAVNDFLDVVFSDEKTWVGIATLIFSAASGLSPLITAGAAIFGIGNVASKAVRAAANRRKKLEVNDYALLYRMQP
jgi:hypothetical protein